VEGELFMPGEEPLVAPGVRALVFDTPRGIYIPMIIAEREGAGDVARYLDALPKDRRVVFPTVISARLRGMLERRGFRESHEWAPEFQEHVEIHERQRSMTVPTTDTAVPAPEADTPEQAWYRGAALMRAAFHQHAKLSEDDPLWGIEIPEYRRPEP